MTKKQKRERIDMWQSPKLASARHGCIGKRRYPSKKNSEATALAMGRDGSAMNAYRCSFCHRWHIGHVPGSRELAMLMEGARMPTRLTGAVVLLNRDGGFGFVKHLLSGQHHFFHRSAMDVAVWRRLDVGEYVSFVEVPTLRGPRAEQIEHACHDTTY